MRYFKIPAYIAGIIVILLVAAFAVVSFYDFNKHKPEIVRMTKYLTGRDISIDGDISVKLGLYPAVVMEGFRLRNVEWGSEPDMVHIKRLDVMAALLPMLSGNIEIRRCTLVEPDILIESNSEGDTNLVFSKSKTEAPPFKIPDINLDRVRIENADRSGIKTAARAIHIHSSCPNSKSRENRAARWISRPKER